MSIIKYLTVYFTPCRMTLSQPETCNKKNENNRGILPIYLGKMIAQQIFPAVSHLNSSHLKF